MNYDAAHEEHCAPAQYCKWDSGRGKCGCKDGSAGSECAYAFSNWATRDVNCEGGLLRFEFTLPQGGNCAQP